MRRARLSHPPFALRRSKLDNLALVPGSLLPAIEQCQAMANELPVGDVLVVVPIHDGAQKQTLLRVVRLLEAQGHHVQLVSEGEIAKPVPPGQLRLKF